MAKFTFANLAQGNVPEANITIYDDENTPLVLGAEQQLGRAGAGGSVYELKDAPDYCVKLFHPKTLADEGKRTRILATLEAMQEQPACARDSRLAWPLGLVRDKDGAKIGYVMRRIPSGFKPFKSLFGGAAAVSRNFPRWGRRELALTAKNFVDTLIFLEDQGVRPADFNPENFMVGEDGSVMFIDCDSFMLFGRSGKAYASEMYFPDCAAPEILRNPEIARGARSVEQTRFSAAVIAFMLVMIGMHPYSYARSEDGSATKSPEENIVAGKTALGSGTGCMMASHWHKLWTWLTGQLQVAFKDTFRAGHSDPCARTHLDVLSRELKRFARECERTPERNRLSQDVRKPHNANRSFADVPSALDHSSAMQGNRAYRSFGIHN